MHFIAASINVVAASALIAFPYPFSRPTREKPFSMSGKSDQPSPARTYPIRAASPSAIGSDRDSTGLHLPSLHRSQSTFLQKPLVGSDRSGLLVGSRVCPCRAVSAEAILCWGPSLSEKPIQRDGPVAEVDPASCDRPPLPLPCPAYPSNLGCWVSPILSFALHD